MPENRSLTVHKLFHSGKIRLLNLLMKANYALASDETSLSLFTSVRERSNNARYRLYAIIIACLSFSVLFLKTPEAMLPLLWLRCYLAIEKAYSSLVVLLAK